MEGLDPTPFLLEVYQDGRRFVSGVAESYNCAANIKRNYKRLTEEAGKLFARKADVEAQVQREKTKRIKEECEAWISKVIAIKQDVQALEDEFKGGKKRKRDIAYWFPLDLSRRMEEKYEELNKLWEEGSFAEVVIEKPPEPLIKIYPPRIMKKSSLDLALEDILGHLRDRNVKGVGLWGMIGIGKTLIIHNLNDNEEIAKSFDIVISVSASGHNSVGEMQQVILRRLKLHLEGDNDQGEVARSISEELESKRYLFLLDGVLEPLDLHAVGIRDNGKDSKVVLASRYKTVCRDMEVDAIIKVDPLSQSDEWTMFREKVGPNIDLPMVEPVARKVAAECGGVPLLIDIIASNFRKKDNHYEWEDGYNQLLKWSSINYQGMEEVLEFLKFCYEDLRDETKKSCFLFGAYYPEDCDIFVDNLLECWNAQGFIHDAENFKEARCTGHSILRCLINVSLLERSKNIKHVRMNKVIRNMALKILSESEGLSFLVKAGKGLQEPPEEEEWKGVCGISLMDNKLHSLPETVDCKDLQTLLLQGNPDVTLIPESFFISMAKLRVLDLQDSGITSLPSSISFLTSLRALYLNSCRDLNVLPTGISSLINLVVLDIRGTRINWLQIEFGHLLQLKCLRISVSNMHIESTQGQPTDAHIRENAISRLSRLEELGIDVDGHNLLQWWNQVVQAIIKEVATLTKLTFLSFCFPTVDSLNIFVASSTSWKSFSFTFRFSIGHHECSRYEISEQFEYEVPRCLRYVDGRGVDQAICQVLAEADVFEIIRHKDILSISEFGTNNINDTNKIRGCLIEGCADIRSIIDDSRTGGASFIVLEKMVIRDAPRLESICAGPLHSGSLARLTALTISKCPMLTKIFSQGVIEQLSKLQQLSVEECDGIEEIITLFENHFLEPGCLPDLKTLTLINLPNLGSIGIDDYLEWPSLEAVTVYGCPSLVRLPFNEGNASKLRYIEAQRTWWGNLEWDEDDTKERLQSLSIFN